MGRRVAGGRRTTATLGRAVPGGLACAWGVAFALGPSFCSFAPAAWCTHPMAARPRRGGQLPFRRLLGPVRNPLLRDGAVLLLRRDGNLGPRLRREPLRRPPPPSRRHVWHVA